MPISADKVNMIPPVGGGLGLPLSMVWRDATLTDETQWEKRFSNASVDENYPIALTPRVSGTASSIATHGILLNTATTNADGLLLSVAAPRLNFEMGQLSLGQIVQDLSTSLYGSETTSCTIGATPTLAEPGRFTEHSRRRNSSPMPANFSYQQPQDDLVSILPPYDLQIGRLTNEGKSGNVRSFTHQTATDLPSNGLGISFGDAHNSIYLSSLNTAPLYTNVAGTGLGTIDDAYDKGYANHWTVNLGVRQPILASGNSLSSPDNLSQFSTSETTNLLLPETAQTIIVNDLYTYQQSQQPEGGSRPPPGFYTGGRLDLGNHAVMDSAGLIGYEGVIMATAFFNVSRHSAGLASSNVVDTEGKLTYAGLNIQVTSGLPLRRNGRNWDGSDTDKQYFDSVGVAEPMVEMMRTEGARSSDGSFGMPTENANCSVAMSGRVRHSTEANTTITNIASYAQGSNAWSLYTGAPSNVKQVQTFGTQGRILGDTHHATAPTGQWTGTLKLSPTFLADRVPTKVRIVPVLRGYTDEVVAPFAGKLVHLPSAVSQTFRKPIVDYHIFVSLANRDDITIQCTLTNDEDGDPTDKNDPDSKRLTANVDLSETPCEIYHGIFRINPTELSQLYMKSGASYLDCPSSVQPVSQGTNREGWGLHQTAPFRPLASAEWPRVPRLSGAIEPGGFYQRGGISHLWDADTYNGEVFVGVDVVDCADLKVQTTKDGKTDYGVWGRGQVWADGTGDVDIPRGSELLVFKYSGRGDYYNAGEGHTTSTDNPLYKVMTDSTSTDYIKGTFNSTINNRNGFTVTVNDAKTGHGWRAHDWVFPQVELMRYLGTEQKDRAKPMTSTALLHPTLHCGALRIVDDGRMMMAAIHRDSISATDEFPLGDIGWPLNPLFGSPDGCPPGWYYDSTAKECKQIGGQPDAPPAGQHYDPIVGANVPGTAPEPLISKSEFIGGTDNFGLWPTWSKLIASTYSRSLILMWSDAQEAKKGRLGFDVNWTRAGGEDYATQNWNHEDTWWSGSRISYWYPESGQRAIPFTYGSYPEVRCSHPQLPRCLPHLFGTTPVVKSGYPLLMPIDRVSPAPGSSSITDRTGVDAWMTARYTFLRRTRFVPTTLGFTDFAVGPNPHQELGWAGWSFPAGLYDPISYGDGTDFFQEIAAPKKPWLDFGARGAAISGFLGGPSGGWSHHGPIHYGSSMSDHPYAVDRTWKQVHSGLGYDVPLHLLKPGDVSVRARAGGSNSIDLEMEVPFHRTELQVVEGAAVVNSGFDKGGQTLPGGSRPTLGQYDLRTNLWNDSIRTHSSNAKLVGLNADEKVRGPIVSGTGLQAFWSDHPTDHFHSGAIPVHLGKDYDLAYVETNRYAATLLGRARELHPLDWVATTEQLQSSVDVHISHTTRPYWDSGSIVTAQGLGAADPKRTTYANVNEEEMPGTALTSPIGSQSLGKGQRICRTPDGTLHVFAMRRSGQSGSSNTPVWNHYTKQPQGDVFFNRKAMKASMSSATFTGKDEVGPLLSSIVTSGSLNGKLHGATFASDSMGTIHAIVEIECDFDNSVSGEPAHTLYYTYAERIIETYNPEPVYSWNWSDSSPISLNPGNVAAGSSTTKSDLRLPSISIDQYDNIHLAAQQVIGNNSHIVYTSKPPEDAWVSSPVGAATGWTDSRWSCVSGSETTSDYPKVMLKGDGVPVVAFRSGTTTAIWVNKANEIAGVSSPSGRYIFASDGAYKASRTNAGHSAIYYDSIIDETDRLFVVAIFSDTGRTTSVNCADMSKSLISQYDATDGIGTFSSLFVPKNANVAPNYTDITMTTNGEGEIHFVLGFMLGGTNADYAGEVFENATTEWAAYPLDWPGQPSARDYDKPANAEWKVHKHFMEVWMPSFEFSQDGSHNDNIIRSINIRWLSVPSLAYDATAEFYPVGSAQTMSGQEDFMHRAPQLRYQRFWGHDSSSLDLRWSANQLSWYGTPNGGSRLYYPGFGGTLADPDEAAQGGTRGQGIAGYST